MADKRNDIKTIIPKITDEYLENEWKNAVIQHLSPNKPWRLARNDYNGNYVNFFDSFWFFASMTPFYDGMKLRFTENTNSFFTKVLRDDISRLPSLDFNKNKNENKYYKLFNSLILLKIKIKDNRKIYKLFGFLPILTIKTKN